MSFDKTLFLVPTDFTKVAETALSHAINLAKRLDGEVCLLHVVSKEINIEPTNEKLILIADKATAETGIKVTYIVRVGNIFDDIGDVAAELGAKFIVMGTHGLTAFQKIAGSHALKVITNSTVPFIVVQENVKNKEYHNIVLPLDLSRDTRQKLQITVSLAKNFNSKIFIVTPSQTDQYSKGNIDKNLDLAKSILNDNGLSYEVETIDSNDYVNNLKKFAVLVGADLIAIVNSTEGGLLGSSEAQEIITNESYIPVLCVNSAVSYSGGMMFS